MINLLAQADAGTPAAGGGLDVQLVALLAFGGAALLVFFIAYWLNKDNLNVTFARLYGLMSVAVLGTALAFTDIPIEGKTAAFTLLGTIAGYLAGAKSTEETKANTRSML